MKRFNIRTEVDPSHPSLPPLSPFEKVKSTLEESPSLLTMFLCSVLLSYAPVYFPAWMVLRR